MDLVLARPTLAECVVAPHMTSAASTIAVWAGRPAIHGGAFLHEGGAWVLLGDKGQGNSSTLGWLATSGVLIVTDDLVVCDGADVLPACAGVSISAPTRRGTSTPAAIWVWSNARALAHRRAALSGEIRCAAGFSWEWGPEATVQRLSPIERVSRLAQHRAIAVPWEDPVALLDLAARPAFGWQRPKGWHTIEGSIVRLLGEIASE